MTDTKEIAKLPEAPASLTVKVKSKNGFEYLITARDMEMSSLFKKVDWVEKYFLANGWTALAQGNSGGFPKKQVNYVPDRKCPTCGNPLVYAETKTGKKFIKCSTNKWDFATKQAVGCAFTEWPQPIQQAPQEEPPIDAY